MEACRDAMYSYKEVCTAFGEVCKNMLNQGVFMHFWAQRAQSHLRGKMVYPHIPHIKPGIHGPWPEMGKEIL